jgi:hypothetical protein
MHWDMQQTELLRGFEPCMADDDDTIAIDNDRLPPAERLNRVNDCIDCIIVYARIIFVRLDSIKRPHFDVHVWPFQGERLKQEGFGRWVNGWLGPF